MRVRHHYYIRVPERHLRGYARAGRVKSFKFDPGSLESIELRMWVAPHSRGGGSGPRIVTRATGTYRVYCGSGWEYTADIDERHQFLLDRPDGEVDEWLATAWNKGDVDAAHDAAAELVEWALDDWNDPCAETEDEW
jgi:hypothetical protein